MCDQNHFEDDLKEYTRVAPVTRRQFGAIQSAPAWHSCCRARQMPQP